MPGFLREVLIHDVVIDDDSIRELDRIFQARVAQHNAEVTDDDRKLVFWYIVRFDNRGYRALNAEDAWAFYKGAHKVEGVVFHAESPLAKKTGGVLGTQLDICLDSTGNRISGLSVAADQRDWVESTFGEFEVVLRRRQDLVTKLVRGPTSSVLVQISGLVLGVLLSLWAATLSAPFLTGLDYPRVVAFGFWFIVFSNLWGTCQAALMTWIYRLFPNVRFATSSEPWPHKLLREGARASGIAVGLWVLGWLTKWAASIIGPFLILPR